MKYKISLTLKVLKKKMENNKIIIITGPSASGKTSLTDKLLIKYNDKLERIKTLSTRKSRTKSDDDSYEFVSLDTFEKFIKENLLIEYEEVYNGIFYGTSVNSIKNSLNTNISNKNYIICLDVNGAWKLKKLLGNRCVTVFCNPQKWEIVNQRLNDRNIDINKQERLLKYNFEMSLKDNFDIEIDTSTNLDLTLDNFQHNVFDRIKNKTLIVNLYGGPGTGKSTMAAALFSELKFMDINCELVTEYAKDKVWEGSISTLEDQLYVFAKQHHRLTNLVNKVDVIITDSPLLISLAYTTESNINLINLVKEYHFKNYNLDIFLNRKKKYNNIGRLQTKEEAINKDKYILNLLDTNLIDYRTFDGTKDSINDIVNLIELKLR